MVIDCWEKEREIGEEKETIAMQEHATVSVAVSFIREVWSCKESQSYEKKIYLEQWSSKKLPRAYEACGLKNLKVSPNKGHPKLPLGAAPRFSNKGRKWFNTTTNITMDPRRRAESSPPSITHCQANSHHKKPCNSPGWNRGGIFIPARQEKQTGFWQLVTAGLNWLFRSLRNDIKLD